jgi:hypothetical protein
MAVEAGEAALAVGMRLSVRVFAAATARWLVMVCKFGTS